MIEVENLYFTYPGSKSKTLNGLKFTVNKGEVFGFLGPSGVGKSTTQKILIGLLKNYKGNVTVMGKEVRKWDNSFYEKIGVSFELPNLYHKLTAIENLNLIRSFYSEKTENPISLLKMVGLEGKADVKVSQYSKGMKMRLNFVRALINNPDLIFLDEPTSGMDPVNARIIKEIILQKKNEGKTIFLTTHNMNLADELSDRVAFIIDGEIKLIDSPKNLKLLNGDRCIVVEYTEGQRIVSEKFELDNIGYNERFISILRSKYIRTIHTQEATLEDIFVRTTGRSLKWK